MNLKDKVTTVVSNVKVHWKTPPEGKYMTYKEIVSLAGGGIGAKFIITCVQVMILAVGNVLIGNVIGIEPKPLYTIYLLSVLSGFPLTALRARMIDNVRSKKGKYRPYIISMGIPTVILAIGFVWMPYERMSSLVKCAVVLLFNVGFQFFYNFYYDVYDNMINVLSPNTQERADVCSIKAVCDSLAPSIINLFIPILAGAFGIKQLIDIRVYRYFYPPLMLVGFLLSVFVYTNTKEKIVQARTHIIQIKFTDAFRAVAKNKYFWIISLAGWLGFLESSYANVLAWMQNYQDACSPAMYGVINTVYGNAALWGMLLAPFLIKRFGKKKVLIYSNILNIFFIALMYPIIIKFDAKTAIWLILICLYMNGIVGAFAHILNPTLQGDIRDYQQYITGERIDGMFATVGLIGSVITLATSGILPAIYDAAGLNEKVAASMGYTNVYDVLYDRTHFENIISVLILASVAGAVLNVIPYFFYDLSEMKQKAMIRVLRVRALFEDYGNDALNDEQLVEAIDIINESKVLAVSIPEDIKAKKEAIKTAKGSGDKKAVKDAKKAYRDAIDFNESIEISQFVVKEMNKFETTEVQAELEVAKKIRAAGLSKLADVDDSILQVAKALPSGTKEEKLYRKKEIEGAKRRLESKKLIAKHYPNGLVKFDRSIFDELFEQEDKVEAALEVAFKAVISAKESKDAEKIKKAKADVKELRAARKIINDKIKKASNENSIYNRAAKPYLDAKRLMVEEENYKHFDEIASMYEEAKERSEVAKAERLAEEKRLDDEKKAAKAKLKAEKDEKKHANKK